MCGIVFKHSFTGQPVNADILQQYDAQRNRGQQGFGLYDGARQNIAKATTEDKILNYLVKRDSDFILFHHRYPTSTRNTKRAAHPFSTHDYFGDTQYILVHNGVVRNADELFVEHQELGIEYRSLLGDLTFNDSESLLWDMALYLEGKQDEPKAYGGIAYIIVKKEKGKPAKLFFGHNDGRPLNMLRTDDSLSLSSEGEGVELQVNTLFTYNLELHRLTQKPLELKQYKYVSNYQKYANTGNGNYERYGSSGYYDIAGQWHYYGEGYPDTINRDFDYPSYDYDFEYDAETNELKEAEKLNQPGGWLPDKVRGKLQGLLAASNPSLFDDEDLGELESLRPDYTAVAKMAASYLKRFKGNFESAYWAMESDYEILAEEVDSEEELRQQLLLEEAIALITDDPEYEDSNSVSTQWRTLWGTV